MRLVTYSLLVLILFVIHACIWAQEPAALRAFMTAEQQAISEKLTALDTKVAEAEKKAAASNNAIELSEARDAKNTYTQDLLQILSKPLDKWAAQVSAVTANRHGGYTLKLTIPMSPGAQSNIDISCDTRDASIINVMKALKNGDIVKFSGKYDGSRSLRSIYIRDFVLENVELVKSK
jgi:hypothetical protein